MNCEQLFCQPRSSCPALSAVLPQPEHRSPLTQHLVYQEMGRGRNSVADKVLPERKTEREEQNCGGGLG